MQEDPIIAISSPEGLNYDTTRDLTKILNRGKRAVNRYPCSAYQAKQRYVDSHATIFCTLHPETIELETP